MYEPLIIIYGFVIERMLPLAAQIMYRKPDEKGEFHFHAVAMSLSHRFLALVYHRQQVPRQTSFDSQFSLLPHAYHLLAGCHV